MCGIVGFLGPKSKTSLLESVETALPYIDHRGPDGWGVYAAEGIALGHTRLSIIDLSGGHQPMISKESSLVFNGEVYNYREIRKDLESLGCTFRTNSDTEVVQQALEQWGDQAFPRFNGQFAILFWDKKKRKLLAGRDRYGMKPLYMAYTSEGIAFSSEIKVFDAISGFSRRWDWDNLYQHGLIWNTLDKETVFQNIYSLPGGAFQWFSLEQEEPVRYYYSLGENLKEQSSSKDVEENIEILREHLKRSVDLRLRSDVPVGCYLSGGIDSSVTSLLTQDIKKERFKSFSVAFEDPQFDESQYQLAMAEHINSQHHTVKIKSRDIQENFLTAAYHFERPVFRTAPVPMYLLSRKVRQEGIKVVLTGEAADEILFGYDSFKEVKLLHQWKNGLSEGEALKVIGLLYPHLSHYKEESHLGLMKMYYQGFLDKIDSPMAGLIIRASNNQVLGKMLHPDIRPQFSLGDLTEKVSSLTPSYVSDWDILRRNQFWEMKSLLSGYLLSAQGDRMAMANGIEGRFPFMDHNLIEWALALPEGLKLTQDYSQKDILKKAFASRLPQGIINRPKRPYMAPDLGAFFPEGQPGLLVQEFLSESALSQAGIFDTKMVGRFLHKLRRRGTANAGYRDNMLITFMLSTQIINKQMMQQKGKALDYEKQTVKVIE